MHAKRHQLPLSNAALMGPPKGCRGRGLSALAALAGAALWAGPAQSQDATWLAAPGSGDFNTGANWSTGTQPGSGDTAFFDTSNITSLTFSASTTIGGWTFNAGADDFDFTNTQILTFNDAGIVIIGGSATINNTTGGGMDFTGNSTAGSATITNTITGGTIASAAPATPAAPPSPTMPLWLSTPTAAPAAPTSSTTAG